MITEADDAAGCGPAAHHRSHGREHRCAGHGWAVKGYRCIFVLPRQDEPGEKKNPAAQA